MWKKIANILLGAILMLILLYFITTLITRPAEECPNFCNQPFLTIAHRGGRGLWPENTLYAFDRATEMGVDVLEMDIHATADGALVTMHDETVDRTTDGRGAIKELSLDEIKALDAGYRWTDDDGDSFPYRGEGIKVPTLEEVFSTHPDMLMNIEIKQVEPSIVDSFCHILDEFDRKETVLVGSFDADSLESFRETCPGVATSVTEPEARRFFILHKAFLDAAYRPPAEAFQLPEYNDDMLIVSEGFIDDAHKHNMAVHVWTVNETDDMARLIDLGVDGIITDYPDRLLDEK